MSSPTTINTALAIIFAACITAHAGARERISVYGLKPVGVKENLAVSLQEHLESNLLAFSSYEVLSRSDMDLILRESSFQRAGVCTDESCLLEASNVLGVQKLVTGTVSRIGSTYNLVLKLIDVGSAKLEASCNRKHTGSADGLLDIGEQLLGELLANRTEPITDTVVKTVVKTVVQTQVQVDTVTVRDTVWAAVEEEPVAPAPQIEEPPVRTEKSRKLGRKLGVGALVALCGIAATVLTVSISD